MVKSMKRVFAFFPKLLAMFRPQAQQFQSQRMCPFCGLITPRAKRFCLECGKSLNPAPPKVKEAKQEG
jgi:predicted amidophosphoribosyltransferase